MDAESLTIDEAAEQLDGLPLVACLDGALAYIKEVRDKCLAAGIPVLVAGPQPGRG